MLSLFRKRLPDDHVPVLISALIDQQVTVLRETGQWLTDRELRFALDYVLQLNGFRAPRIERDYMIMMAVEGAARAWRGDLASSANTAAG